MEKTAPFILLAMMAFGLLFSGPADATPTEQAVFYVQ
jgi:hypothetical protein